MTTNPDERPTTHHERSEETAQLSPAVIEASPASGPPAEFAPSLAPTTEVAAPPPAAVTPQPPMPAGVNVNVSVSQQASPIIIVQRRSGPGMLVRVIWFLFVGWWVGQLALLLGWALILTVIGLPLGLMVLNRLPQVFTLRPYTEQLSVTQVGGATLVESVVHQQYPWWARAIYFALVGWWASLVWMEIAWLCGISLILLPVSFVMFSKVAAVTTLRRI